MIQTISHLSGLTPGHQLWLIVEPEKSFWSQKINWYLNFQISKSLNRKSTELPSELIGILKEIEWENFQPKSDSCHSMMISCSDRLPAQWVVLISTKNVLNPDDWWHEAHQIWEKLKKPSLRIFLPTDQDSSLSTGFSASQATEELKKFEPEHTELSVVLDPKTISST